MTQYSKLCIILMLKYKWSFCVLLKLQTLEDNALRAKDQNGMREITYNHNISIPIIEPSLKTQGT
jgi:hypothetical protein